MSRQYDVVVFGASGYTGRWVVEELLGARRGETIAVAGRSASRVRETLSHHSANLSKLIAAYCQEQALDFLPVIECDSNDAAALERMAQSARVVIATAGPFNSVGMPVVAACVRAKTAYVDITGEPLFVERTYVEHHETAKKNGVTIVNCCGFDCVPSDMAVDQILKRVPNVRRIEGFLTSNAHGNTGTLFTAVEGVRSSAALALQRRSSPRPRLPPSKFKPKSLFRHPQLGYCVQFPGADPTIVRHSQGERKERFGIEPVEIGLYFSTKSLLVFLVVMWVGIVIYLAVKLRPVDALLRRFPRLLTLGVFESEPDPRSLAQKRAQWTFLFATSDNKKGEAVVRLRDPGYSATATCVVAAALTIARNLSRSPRGSRKSGQTIPAGVVTSATAFTETDYFETLQQRGVQFELTFPK